MAGSEKDMYIHHVGYLCKDIEKTKMDFLSLGYVVEQEAIRDELRDLNILFLRNGAYRIELVKPNRNSSIYPLLKTYKNAPYHICYGVANLEDAIASFTLKGGYIVIQEPMCAPAIRNRKVCFLVKKSLGMIELVEEKENGSNS